jgi:heme/copper-type cytochrome/quinol oxidase subunit 3
MNRLDVSLLPHGALDHRGLIWWGNLLLLAIETTMFALLVAAYLYFRQNITPWPPPRVQRFPVLLDPNPALLLPTVNLALLLASCVPTYLGDLAAKALDRRGVLRWDVVSLSMGVAAIVLRFFEFGAIHFRWDENAYASLVWVLLGTHLAHLFVMVLEEGNTFVWVALRGLDKKHALDMRVSAIYWYWVVGVWVLLYALIYLSPRLL